MFNCLARTCSAYPRLCFSRPKAWMAGARPAKTKLGRDVPPFVAARFSPDSPARGAAERRANRTRHTNSPVQQHVAGAVDLGGEIVGAAVVGVQFDHQAAVRVLDRVGVGSGRETEDGVGLLDTHVPACRPRVPAARACGALSGELVTPVP